MRPSAGSDPREARRRACHSLAADRDGIRNNRMALVEPILWTVSDVMLANPRWPAKGLEWLEAFDEIDLCENLGQRKASERRAS
jgi:hypothetical protein